MSQSKCFEFAYALMRMWNLGEHFFPSNPVLNALMVNMLLQTVLISM